MKDKITSVVTNLNEAESNQSAVVDKLYFKQI